MLLRYKNMEVKPQGVYVVVPYEARVSASLTLKSKKVLCNPFGEMPEVDAKFYAENDPNNFEVANEGDVKIPGSEGPSPMDASGTEISDDKPVGPKKRGRKPKVQTEQDEAA